ncbi:MAG: hypothetical protein ACK4EY_09315 [Flavipsychrobacter sp.]
MAILLTLGSCITDTNGQCGKNCKSCSKKPSTTKSNIMDTANKTLSCKLTSPELRKRKEEVIAELKKEILEKKELPDGYSYKFNGSDDMLDKVNSFIKSERLCCDFFNFKITLTNDTSLWLDIYGPEGAKEFITTELEM